VVNLEGRHIATHRTYLQPNGNGKATLLEAKKAIGKYQGGFIPLWKGEHDCRWASSRRARRSMSAKGSRTVYRSPWLGRRCA
jgi:ABC-type cobalamin/Fe3+-siderophores transport system ATPase subunit